MKRPMRAKERIEESCDRVQHSGVNVLDSCKRVSNWPAIVCLIHVLQACPAFHCLASHPVLSLTRIMAVGWCFLCGNTTGNSSQHMHQPCVKALHQDVQQPAVLNMLRACLEPSFPAAEDEMEIHQQERWMNAFRDFVARLPNNRLTLLPPELLFQIASFSQDDALPWQMRLQDIKTTAGLIAQNVNQSPPPRREVELALCLGAKLRIQQSHFGGRSYVVSCHSEQNACGDGHTSITLSESEAWSAVVAVLDVCGCRSISLSATGPWPRNAWLRIIPRAMLTTSPRTFICRFKGLALRDIVPSSQPDTAPLFDAVPASVADLIWYSESYARSGPCPTPRMMQRTVPASMTGITLAFAGGSSIDFHLHDGNIFRANAFYTSLEALNSPLVLRYTELLPDETVVDVGIRLREGWDGCSSACLAVCLQSPLEQHLLTVNSLQRLMAV